MEGWRKYGSDGWEQADPNFSGSEIFENYTRRDCDADAQVSHALVTDLIRV